MHTHVNPAPAWVPGPRSVSSPGRVGTDVRPFADGDRGDRDPSVGNLPRTQRGARSRSRRRGQRAAAWADRRTGGDGGPAFHEGDAAFAHLHPTTKVNGDNGGPELSFHAELPTSGNWRLFLQFQTGGKLHTAALTLNVG
ncbi:hypothetical protein ACFUNF_22680 [Streptomyces sp. NPDC057291]|uniref:hypothetical protein n=1 Tax=Streptomyces sp. NPDC057291 TaxID=3346087 RepID=UPI0036433305